MTIRIVVSLSLIALAACTPSSLTMVGREFSSPQGLEVAEPVGSMTVVRNAHNDADGTGDIAFKGEVTLTGEYWDMGADDPDGLGRICMRNFTLKAGDVLPVRRYAAEGQQQGSSEILVTTAAGKDASGEKVCFDRGSALAKGFKAGTEGEATVTIDNYVLELDDLETGVNRAEIVRVTFQ